MKEAERRQVIIPPIFEDVKNPDYKTIYATGLFGGLDPNDARMIFYVDHIEPETINEPQPGSQKVKKVVREYLLELHVSPTQFKSIAKWMNAHIKRYEDMFGDIPMAPKGRGPPESMVT